jgi:ABC-type sugar transport system ATPase subunit
MASISLRNLSKTFPNGVAAVSRANLEIDNGELLALVGPSGCGKSTTLRLIAGLEDATSGDVYFDDQRAGNLPPSGRNIAMVFQDDALYPHMTVRNNLAFGLKMRKAAKAEIEQRIVEVARVLSLDNLLQYKPYMLSGGQRQRVALGRAIIRHPRVFLFDEPLSSLDAHQREKMRAEIIELHRRSGTTMVYVTHDQAEAMSLGHRVAVMNKGVIEQVDSPMELYRRPKNRFVAGFIGSPAMTFLEGHIDQGVFRWEQSTLHVETDYDHGQVTLGVRPEDWVVDEALPVFTKCQAEAVQHLGHETLIQFTLGEETSCARMAACAEVNEGDSLRLSIRPNRWHLFSCDGQQCRLGD